MATVDLERLVVQLSADIKRFESSFQRASGIASKEIAKVEARAVQLDTRLSTIGAGFSGSLGAFLSVGAAVASFKELTAAADEWIILQNKLNSSADFAGVQVKSLNELKDAANNARADVSSYVDLYSKLIASASKVAASENDISRATNIIAKSFKAGGAAASEQANGILQLGQALGSGVLQGDELRSIRENAPVLARAIAAEFKTTVAGLKQLGAEGKLTSDRILKAILAFEGPVNSAFAKTRSTVGDAISRINNEFLEFIGNADSANGTSQKLVEALNYLAENFDEVAAVIVNFVAILTGALVGRGIAGLIVGIGNAVAALGTFIVAARAGTLAAATFSSVLGPIGIIAGAAAAAYLLMGDNISAAEKAAIAAEGAFQNNVTSLGDAKTASEGYTKALRDQISMQYEAAKSAAILAQAEADSALDRSLSFRKTAKEITGLDLRFDPFEYAATQAENNAIRVGNAAYELEKQLSQVDANLLDPNKGFGGGLGDTDAGVKKAKKGKTDAQKFAEDLEAAKQRIANLKEETALQAQLNPLTNDYGEAIAALKFKQDLLNDAKKNGIAITPELAKTIDGLAVSYGQASSDAARLAEAQDKVRENAQEMAALGKDVTRGFIDGFIQGKSAAELFADALSKIGNKLLDLAFNAAFDTGSGGGSAGIFGGLISSIFGGGKSAAASPPSFLNNGFDTSGPSAPSLSRLASPAAGASTVVFSPNVDARGADAAAVARIDAGLRKVNNEFESRVIATSRTAGKSNFK